MREIEEKEGKMSHRKTLDDIGNRRISKLRQEYQQKGYTVLTNKEFFSGIDLLVLDTTKGTFNIVKVIESTNWNPRGYLTDQRMERYIKSLNFFKPTTREIIFSYDSNLSPSQKQKFIQNGILVTIKEYRD